MHQQLWGYKVEWKSVSRGTGGKKGWIPLLYSIFHHNWNVLTILLAEDKANMVLMWGFFSLFPVLHLPLRFTMHRVLFPNLLHAFMAWCLGIGTTFLLPLSKSYYHSIGWLLSGWKIHVCLWVWHSEWCKDMCFCKVLKELIWYFSFEYH
jgi:hypothetical protein